MSLVQEGEIIPLDEISKKLLKDDVVRNGGEVLDPKFSALESFLMLNPLDEGSKAKVSEKNKAE
jgi:hypothetical protein